MHESKNASWEKIEHIIRLFFAQYYEQQKSPCYYFPE